MEQRWAFDPIGPITAARQQTFPNSKMKVTDLCSDLQIKLLADLGEELYAKKRKNKIK